MLAMLEGFFKNFLAIIGNKTKIKIIICLYEVDEVFMKYIHTPKKKGKKQKFLGISTQLQRTQNNLFLGFI